MRFPIGALLALVFVACGDDATMSSDPDGSVEPRPPHPPFEPRFVEASCRLDDPTLPPPSTRRCGSLEVPQLRDVAVSGARGTISLHLEILEPTRPGPATIFLSGGPGFSLTHYRPRAVLGDLVSATTGPVVLLEQRGNALSDSGLGCSDEPDADRCAAGLRADGIVPEAFNSLESASDVADAIRALELAPAVVWGHSYGTVLAQRVAHQHPEVVRALVLEAVAHPTRVEPGDQRAQLEVRLTILEEFASWHRERCIADDACRAAYPMGLDPRSDVLELIGRFMGDPSLTLPLGGGLSLDGGGAQSIFSGQLAYHDGMLLALELFHALIARERDGDDGAALTALRERLGGEDAANAALSGLLGPDPRGPSLSPTVKSCFDYRGALEEDFCAGLDDSLYPPSVRFAIEERVTDTPTLVVHGSLDTQSPLQNVRLVEPLLSTRSEAVFSRCVGHFVLGDATECVAGAVRDFVDGRPWTTERVAECEARVCEALPILSGS